MHFVALVQITAPTRVTCCAANTIYQSGAKGLRNVAVLGNSVVLTNHCSDR